MKSDLLYSIYERLVPGTVMIIIAISFTVSAADLLSQIGLYSLPLIALLTIISLYIAFTVVYEHYVIIRSGYYRVPDAPRPLEVRSVSIIVPTRNEPPDMVEETLLSIKETKYHPLEVIVTDESDPEYYSQLIGVCRRNGALLIRGERSGGFNAAAIRRALKHAKGDLVGILDSDYRVDPDWLRRTVRLFQISWIDAVRYPQSYRNLDLPIVRIADAFRAMQIHKDMARMIDNVLTMSGTTVLYRREVLEEFFTGNYVTEDFASSVRMILKDRRAFYCPNRLGLGLGPLRIIDYARQQARWLDNLRVYLDYIREIMRLKPRIKIIHLSYQSMQTLYHLAVSSLVLVGLVLLPISFRAGLAILILYTAESLYKFGYAKLHSIYLKVVDLPVWLITDFVSAPHLLMELLKILVGRPSLALRTPKEG